MYILLQIFFAIAKKDGDNPLPEVAHPATASFATTISVAYISNYSIVKKTVDTLRIRSIKEVVVVMIGVITCYYYCYYCVQYKFHIVVYAKK
jgi:cation transport ATPase